ncbi:hypothetical protein VTO42DRAFT_8047 [Malbranchea cinnamomea]
MAREHDLQGDGTPQYHTFSTSPPKSRGRPLTGESASTNDESQSLHGSDESETDFSQTPIPKRQMAVLAIMALCEQTALNSISPYLPEMASSFPGIQPSQVGMYVGTIASSFALAQFVTSFFWGWVSDRVGRKPVILLGTILTASCFVAFGFCRTLWQAVVVQMVMGIVNGNQGIVSTCLGEITDRSNQSRAFTYLPVIYGIGGITGPALGGFLAAKQPKRFYDYPYVAPNLASAVILVFDFVVAAIFLEESLQDAPLPKIGRKIRDLFAWLWQFTSSTRPSYLRSDSREDYPAYRRSLHRRLGLDEENDSDSISTSTPLFPIPAHHLHQDEILNRDMILLLFTYLIFALSNVSYNSLYPIFAQAKPPSGRALTPQEIGATQAFAGLVSIAFQILIFGKMRDKMGNRWSYRAGLLGFVIAFALMPFVGHKDERALKGEVTKASVMLTIELCTVLLVKTIAAVGGLTSALLLLTNSAPDHSVLGALNGLAQTLSAAGRAAGPFLSGGLFSLSTHVRPKGEAVAFGIFGGVSFVGFLLSFGIRSTNLEAAGWSEQNDDDVIKSDDDESYDNV